MDFKQLPTCHGIFRTAILAILGNGAVANVELKELKGHQSGWLVIAVGYSMGL